MPRPLRIIRNAGKRTCHLGWIQITTSFVHKSVTAYSGLDLARCGLKVRSAFQGTPITSVTFRRGDEIDQRDAGVSILQKYWKGFAPRDTSDWDQRITNSGNHMVAAYVDNVIAGILEGIRLDIGGDPYRVPATFQELTADGTWSTHRDSGDTVVLVDLTIAPAYHGVGLFEALAHYARQTFESPSGFIFTYSPLFFADCRYWVVQKHERMGAKLTRELPRSRPGLTMMVGGEGVSAEDVGITAYAV